MSQSDIARFPGHRITPAANDKQAADSARKRISELPDQYKAHAAPNREDLVGVVEPVSPAAELKAATKGEKPSSPVPAAPAVASVISTTGAAAPSSPLEKAAEPKSKKEELKPNLAPDKKPKTKRKLPSRLKPLITGLITFALLFMLFKAPIFLNQLSYLTHKPTPATPAVATVPVSATPTLSIPKINVSVPIVMAQSNQEAAIQKDLETGVVHYAGTALPGENGNSVIFGHSSNDWWEPGNYKFVFVLLDKLVIGDTFTADYNGTHYIYQVTESKVVEPTDLSVLASSGTPEMTLITCTPPGTSWKRLVIKAKQISPSAKDKPAVAGNNNSSGALPGNSPSLSDQISKLWKNFTGLFTGDKPASESNASSQPAPTTIPAVK
jgi:LPXTG-site transpeptidase (sortase) family protein